MSGVSVRYHWGMDCENERLTVYVVVFIVFLDKLACPEIIYDCVLRMSTENIRVSQGY